MLPEDVPPAVVPWAFGVLLTALLAALGFLLRRGLDRELARVDAKASAEKVEALELQCAEHQREIAELRRCVHLHADHLARAEEQIRTLIGRN